MDPPNTSKRSRFKKWAREAKDDVKHGFKRVFDSNPTSRSSSPGPLSGQAPHESEGTSSTNNAPADRARQTLLTEASPARLHSTPPALLGSPSQPERIPSTFVPSSPEPLEIGSVIESSSTLAPNVAQLDLDSGHSAEAPIAQGTPHTGQPQAPVGLSEPTPADTSLIDSPQAPQTSDSGDSQLPSSPKPIDNPSDATTAVQEEKPKESSPCYAGIRATLALIERASDAFPPLKSTVAGINGILDIYDAFGDNKRDFERLAERVKLVDAILRSSPQDAPQEFKDRRDGLERSLKGLTEALEAKGDRTRLERVARSTDDQQEILRLVREVSFAIEIAMFDVTIRNETLILQAVKGINWLKDRQGEEYRGIQEPLARIEKGVAALCKAETLKSLGDVKNFAFSNGTRRRECVPGSRVGLVSELLVWGVDRDTSHAFWLSGMAGTGKTAVSETFCSQLSKRRLLGASFFCSLTSQELSDVRLIIPSLAKALAKARPEFGNALTTILDEELGQGNDPLLMKIPDQYEHLILDPAKEAFQDTNDNVVLSVDALDECKDKDALLEFLQVVLSTKPPPALKIFLTSRPESLIREPIESSSSPSRPQLCRLHDIERDIVRADIELFVNHELGKIIQPLPRAYQGTWPPPEVQTIVEHSGTLFIVAATIMRYIGDRAGNRINRFQAFGRADAPTLSGIHQLYHNILKAAYASLNPSEEKDVLACLSLLVVAHHPLSVTEYAGLLDCSVGTIREAFRSLHSVVQIPPSNSDDGLITIYHASFVDFLTEHQSTPAPTSTNSPWSVDRPQAHFMVTKHCFRIMNTNLQFNIADIPSSFIFDCDNPQLQDKITQNLPPALHYSCQGWSQHLSMTIPDPTHSFIPTLYTFLQLKVLFWIEAMNLLGSATQCDPDLCRASEWLEELNHDDSTTLAQQLRNTGSFALYFSTSPASQSTPHLYLSSLATWPQNSGPPLAWKKHFPTIPEFQAQGSQRSVSLMNINVGSEVCGVAVSPDGKYIASGCGDGSVRIWDAQNGKQVKILEGHSACVRSVAFSKDGQHVVSGSDDKSVCLWNIMTGEKEQVLLGHTGWVHSVAFSNDSNHIVSAGDDNVVQLWNTTLGEEEMVLQGHTRNVYSVAFSPDGTRIASGSPDKSVRLWDTKTGEQLMLLEGHTDEVNSVTFSGDGAWIASGSDDKSVRVWKTATGREEQVMWGHTGWVRSVAFFSDGTQIVSGSGDNTVRLWDVGTGRELKVLQGHTSDVMSVAFSTDGRRLISGSLDKSVRVWDMAAGEQEEQALQGHTGAVTSVSFSEAGTRIVSGSGDRSVRVWNGVTGEQLKILEGHTAPVNSVAFSPDGTQIVSGSDDKSVRVWDAVVGQEQLVLEGHTGTVFSVAFSSDGARIVSASGDRSVRIWDAAAGEEQTVLNGHTRDVCSATFSRDGKWIASGSGDQTVQIWDVDKGEQLRVLEGHIDWVRSVGFSPDGTHIVSGSDDQSVRIWDALTGEVQHILKGHTNWVWSVAFSRDGTQIVSGSRDCTVRVWDSTTGEGLLVLKEHTSSVQSVAFSRDSTQVVSGSRDQTIRVWDLKGLSYTSEVINGEATGWLLTSGDRQNHLMYAPTALVPQSPCILLISSGPTYSSFLSPLTFSLDAIGDNWQKCYTPLP